MAKDKVYKIPFTPQLHKISIDIHKDLTKLLKIRSPKANLFSEDPDVEQLYYAWILIKADIFKFSELEGKKGSYILFEGEL